MLGVIVRAGDEIDTSETRGNMNDNGEVTESTVDELLARIDALQDLLMCYRIGKNPPEHLHIRLAETQRAEVAVRIKLGRI